MIFARNALAFGPGTARNSIGLTAICWKVKVGKLRIDFAKEIGSVIEFYGRGDHAKRVTSRPSPMADRVFELICSRD